MVDWKHYQLRSMISLRRRRANDTADCPQNLTAGEIAVDDQMVALGETTIGAKTESGGMEVGGPEDGGKSKCLVLGGGYGRDRPPEDDCCPICAISTFHAACCFLHVWEYGRFKQCVCPICGFLIFKKVVARFNPDWLILMVRVLHLLTATLRVERIYYQTYGSEFFPYGWRGILMFYCACFVAVLILAIRKRWNRLRRER